MALKEYTCPHCGGAVSFDSATQHLKCPYCETEFDIDALDAHDSTNEQMAPDDQEWQQTPDGWGDGEDEHLRVYICKTCGGEIIGDENTAAKVCPYCGNPVVMTGKLSGSLRPDYVIPFKLDKQAAMNAFARHLQGKFLLPKVFTSENHLEEIQGTYVPFWLFDTEAVTEGQYKGTTVRTWQDRNFIYTETSFYSVYRAGNALFEHVPVDGSSKMADDMMESLEPFDFSQAVDFKTAYLAGYLADKYDVSADQSQARANQRVKTTAEQELMRTVSGYASVVPERTSVRYKNSRAKYALYPVWILNTRWRGELYTFAMNGQTGKFVGDLPVDKGKMGRTFLLTFVLTAAILFVLMMLGTRL